MDLGALALSHLADAAIRAFCLAMLALAALTLARVRSVSARHAVWTAVLLSMLSLPLLTPALPPIPVPILKASPPVAVAPVSLTPTGQARPLLPIRNFARIVSTPRPAPFPWRKAALALYLGIVLVMLGRLAVSYLLVRRLVRASIPIRGEWARDYADRSAVLRESGGIAVPITTGCFRPQVLLPPGWREWSQEKLDAALSHELAHVRRRDSLIALIAGVNKAVFWFHPLAWWLERKLALLAEDACDDASLLAIGDRQRYASVLLEMAAAAHGGRKRLHWEAIAMARPSTLRRRIDRILDETRRISGGVSRGRWMALSLMSAALLYGAAAIQLQSVPTPAPPRIPASSVPAPASQFASPVQLGGTPAGRLSESERRLRDERRRMELGSPYRKWLDEDVVYITSDEERAAFQQLSTDEQRENFIEQFWLKRDPTPGTPENEFKEEHYRRIAYANQRFASSIAGWKTERGLIYITFGPPDEVESHPAGNQGSPPYEIWRYRSIEGVGANVQIEFIDTARTGEYRMTMGPTEKSALLMVPKLGLTLLEQMPLTPAEGPQSSDASVNRSFTIYAFPVDVRVDYTRDTDSSALANITLLFDRRYLQFQPVNGAQKATVNIYGRVTSIAMRPVSTFEDVFSVEARQDPTDAVSYTKAIRLAPGIYRLFIVAKDMGSGRMANQELTLNVRGGQ